MGNILIGTSGYSYDDWIGPFYPAGSQKRDFLDFYSKEFKLVELNYTYYSQPKPSTFAGMVRRTEDDFLFAVKAHRSLTHDLTKDNARNTEGITRNTEGITRSAQDFKMALQVLSDANRLAAVLLQFPYSFHYTPENRKHLDQVCRLLSGLPLTVEFRNSEWQREQVYQAMRERGISLVNVDEPSLPRLPVPGDTFTADPAYIRFHGRNAANWWQGDNTTRYDYLYTDEELSEWIDRITEIVKKAKLLLIAFNNHYKAQAVKNARRLRVLLRDRGLKQVL